MNNNIFKSCCIIAVIWLGGCIVGSYGGYRIGLKLGLDQGKTIGFNQGKEYTVKLIEHVLKYKVEKQQ